MIQSTQASTIAALNDQFRQTFRGGDVLLTSGVQSLPAHTRLELMKAVQTFSSFTEENDPHGEHDFGSLIVDGQTFFFKIDYYDANRQYGSENPADPSVTCRVLTLMLNTEY